MTFIVMQLINPVIIEDNPETLFYANVESPHTFTPITCNSHNSKPQVNQFII
jgi:hypothetical protein